MRKNKNGKHIFSKAKPYIMIAPSITVFVIFFVYPIIYMIYLSFFKWDMLNEKVFVGLGNYKKMFGKEDFIQVIGNSFEYMFLTVVITIVLALLLALYLKKNTKLNAFLQSVVFAPHVISFVSVSFIWMWMMDSSYGLFNFILSLVGTAPVKWLQDPEIAMFSLVMVAVWKGIGYNALIFLSGLQSIPQYVYEAASLDKAKPHSVFFKITLPMLSPTLFFLILINIIGSFKVFETISLMTEGGPMNSTNTLVYSIYEYGFSYYKVGYASAMGVVLGVIIGSITLIYFGLMSNRVHYR